MRTNIVIDDALMAETPSSPAASSLRPTPWC